MNYSEHDKDKLIQSLEIANKENILRIKYIENLLSERDNEIAILREELKKEKKGYSSQKLIFKYSLFKFLAFFSSLPKDVVYAYELLKREGVKSFFYRLFWYIRGKRLIEDIHDHKKYYKTENSN